MLSSLAVQVVLGSLKVPNGQLRIMSGKTRPQRYSVVPPSNDDANDLSHDAAGLLSVRRGGGALPMWDGSGLGLGLGLGLVRGMVRVRVRVRARGSGYG